MIFFVIRVESSSISTNAYNPQKIQTTTQNNRNYYNASQQGYEPQQYDSYYSVYDDDVELYRDVGKFQSTFSIV